MHSPPSAQGREVVWKGWRGVPSNAFWPGATISPGGGSLGEPPGNTKAWRDREAGFCSLVSDGEIVSVDEKTKASNVPEKLTDGKHSAISLHAVPFPHLVACCDALERTQG